MSDTERRRRGVVCGLITQLIKLKTRIDQPETLSHARQMAQQLQGLDTEFKQHNYVLVELIEKEKDLEKEQKVLHEHKDEISELTEMLIASCTPHF